MSRNGKIHTKKRQFRQMPVLAFLNQRLFLQPLRLRRVAFATHFHSAAVRSPGGVCFIGNEAA